MKKNLLVLIISLFSFVNSFAATMALDIDCMDVIADQLGWIESYDWINTQDEACQLKTVLNNQNGGVDLEFKIFVEALYVTLNITDPTILDYKKSFDLEVQKFLNDQAIENGFLFLCKEKSGDGGFYNRVYFDPPKNIEPFKSLNALELDALRMNLQEVANLAHGDEVITSTEKEKAVLTYLLNFIENDGLMENAFLESGFEKAILENEINIQRNVDDSGYSPFLLKIENGANYSSGGQYFEEIVENEFSSYGNPAGLTYSVYITGKEQFESNQFIQETKNDFHSDSSKLKLWIHFDFATELSTTLKNNEINGSRDPTEIRNVYVISDSNLTKEESEDIINESFEKNYLPSTEQDGSMGTKDCTSNWQWGKKCLFHNANDFNFPDGGYLKMQAALTAGFVDGFLGTLKFLYEAGGLLLVAAKAMKAVDLYDLNDVAISLVGSPFGLLFVAISRLAGHESAMHHLSALVENPKETLLNNCEKIGISLNKITNGVSGMVSEIYCTLVDEFESEFNSSMVNYVLYYVGIVAFEIVLSAITAGALPVIKSGAKVGVNIFTETTKFVKKTAKGGVVSSMKNELKTGRGIDKLRSVICYVTKNGCFIKDTPVLMASNSNQFSFRNSGRALAFAATMPIVAVPIQEVQLLDYAVAHETVNAEYGLTASVDDDIYLGLMDKDPYTSDQQRKRDEYEINDTDWNEVVFEEVNGSSTAKLALHYDWINQKGYQVDGVVNLDLPEQGLSGPFNITSIKHIVPQKKPVDEDESDDYNYKPVTALFTHESNQVHNIGFDNGESLGVTYQHPIYSTTAGDWKLAGELEIGEKVLTKEGEATVTSSVKKEGSETVYNLEVKELHNFLVGESGIVVHNNYFYNWTKKLEYFENGVKVLRKPIDHIWDGHSFLKKKPNKSYFRERYSSRAKIQKLIEDVTNKVEIGDIKKVHNSGGNVDWIIVDARKALNGANDFIGKDKNGVVTKYLKVVIDHIDVHGKIIPKTAFPIDFIN